MTNVRITAAINDCLDPIYADATLALLDSQQIRLVADESFEDVYGIFEHGTCIAILYLQHSDVCRGFGIGCDIELTERFERLLDERVAVAR